MNSPPDPTVEDRPASQVLPGAFRSEEHFYEKVLNAPLHPLVTHFLNLSRGQLVTRYCHLHPAVIPPVLERLLSYRPLYLHWSGSDLMNVTTATGRRQIVVIETNTCPSGQKSMPLMQETDEQGGYRALLVQAFRPLLQHRRLPEGGLAVVFDKNVMENLAYARAMADLMNEPVWLVEYHQHDPDPPVRFDDGVMQVRDTAGAWHPVRAAFRYVTQRPWNRIPALTRTLMFNPVVACLAGGRNKLVAAKAYDMYNAELSGVGLQIRTPHTIRDVHKAEVPLWLRSLGGYGVIKIPYSNAGQGVFTITGQHELDAFMAQETPYEQFIVQSLIGNANWSSRSGAGQFYHVGTVPDPRRKIYVADLRMMICTSPRGFRPVALYARRTPDPLLDELPPDVNSWGMLGTNLSVKRPDGSFTTDPSRLIPMDRKSFNQLGLGLDDLIEAYIQTVLSSIAIDRLAATLVTKKGKFRHKMYRSLNNDEVLLREIMGSHPGGNAAT